MDRSSSHRLARVLIRLGSAATLIALLPACAQTRFVTYSDERCLAVLELPDGSWQVNYPITFGRTIRVESGATLYKGEVIDGVDLGAVLQRRCRDPSLNVTETAVRF